MSKLIDRVLMAYRPLYLRGLLMDGQYAMLKTEKDIPTQGTPTQGTKAIHLLPAFGTKRPRKLVIDTVAAATTHHSMKHAAPRG